MSNEETSSVVADAEVAAPQPQTRASRASSAPDARRVNAVVPVPVPVQPDAPLRPKLDPTAGRDVPAEAAVAAPVEDMAAQGRGHATEPAPAAPRESRTLRIVCRGIDAALWAVNRPFEWMGPRTRRVTGLVGIATLVTSLLAMYLLPSLLPRRSVVAELHERAAAMAGATGSLPARAPKTQADKPPAAPDTN